MKQKNDVNPFDKLSDFDNILFDYYHNQNNELPISTQKTIENALKNHHKEKSTTIEILKRVAIFILSISIITTTTVYAKDIINFITSIFNNSTPAIDNAVNNGYIQNVDMEFIKYNDIGIKVDYLLIDDYNLNISFVYKYFGETTNIKELKYANLSIKDEQNNILCFVSEDTTNTHVINSSINSTGEQQFINGNTIRDSLLMTSEKLLTSQTLYIEISKVTLTLNEEIKYINGNWNFSIDLDNNFVTRNSYEYSSNSSSYVDNIITSLNPTSLSIELYLNTSFDESTFYTRNAITLTDESNNTYRPIKMLSHNNNAFEPYSSTITLIYPISIYDNINKLYLHIDLSMDKQINIELTK